MTRIEWFLCVCIVTCLVFVGIGPDWFSRLMAGGVA